MFAQELCQRDQHVVLVRPIRTLVVGDDNSQYSRLA